MATFRTPRITVDIESFRVAADISVLKLSDQSGIARTTLRRYLPNPGGFTLDQIATLIRVLNIPADAVKVAA